MRVLVLGATGFIGTRVVDELVLQHGAEVCATVRDYRTAVRLGRVPVEWVEASATDPQAMREASRGCDGVVHCAHPFSSPSEAPALDLCRAAVAAAAATTTRRLVYVSTMRARFDSSFFGRRSFTAHSVRPGRSCPRAR